MAHLHSTNRASRSFRLRDRGGMKPVSDTLSLIDAQRIVAGAVSKASEMNIAIKIAICDAGGGLVAFGRMDGANVRSDAPFDIKNTSAALPILHNGIVVGACGVSGAAAQLGELCAQAGLAAFHDTRKFGSRRHPIISRKQPFSN